jgi:uncharacterized protein YndB with AHSA1/START domain
MADMNMSHSIIVNAPIEKVFEAFCDPQSYSEWSSTPHEVRGYAPPLAIGKEYETVSTLMGREMITTNTVTAFEPPHRYVRTIDGAASGETQQVVEAVDAGVEVSIIFNGEMKGFLGNLVAPLIKGQIRKQMENDLNSFKAYIEN